MSDVIKGDVLTKEEMKQRGIVLITTERGGFELRAKSSTSIATWLVDMGFVEEYEYIAATIFMDLRRAYEASQGIKWMALRDQILEGLRLSSGEACELYDKIRREIGLKSAGKIYGIISDAILSPYRPLIAEEANVYRIAFVTLSDAMEKVKKDEKALACI